MADAADSFNDAAQKAPDPLLVSYDETTETLQQQRKDLAQRIIRATDTGGLSRLNEAVNASRGLTAGILNGQSHPTPGQIRPVLDILEKTREDLAQQGTLMQEMITDSKAIYDALDRLRRDGRDALQRRAGEQDFAQAMQTRITETDKTCADLQAQHARIGQMQKAGAEQDEKIAAMTKNLRGMLDGLEKTAEACVTGTAAPVAVGHSLKLKPRTAGLASWG